MRKVQILVIVLSVLLMSIFSVNLASAACIDLVKTGPVTAMPGDTITYHFWVQNCGDQYLKYVVEDPLFDGNPISNGFLDPGADTEFDKTYILPDDNCDPITNSALAIGQPWNECQNECLRDGCGGDCLPPDSDEDSWTVNVICEPPPQCQTDLIAGQNWDSPAGVVTVWDDGEYLYVTFKTTGDWSLGETHLYVGTVQPTKAAPGRFPFKNQTGGYKILLNNLGVVCGNTLYIAAHAVVSQGCQQETAWADSYGIPFNINKGWAMYFQYEVCDGCIEP